MYTVDWSYLATPLDPHGRLRRAHITAPLSKCIKEAVLACMLPQVAMPPCRGDYQSGPNLIVPGSVDIKHELSIKGEQLTMVSVNLHAQW